MSRDPHCLLLSQQLQARLIITQTPDHQTTHWVFLSEGKHSGSNCGLNFISPRPVWKLRFKIILKKPDFLVMEDTVVKATQTREQQDKKLGTHVYRRCRRGPGAFYLKNRNGLRGAEGLSSLHLTAQVK